MKGIRRKMRNNGGFGPSLRKPLMKKEPSKLMKDSLKQLKKTRECYKVFKRDTSHVTVVPHENNFASSSRQGNGIKSSHDVQKNTKMSRTSSLHPGNGVFSSRNTTKSSSSPNIGMVCSQNDTKSRPSSLRSSTNGVALPSKNVENPRTSSSRLKSEASLSKNTRLPRSSSTRPNNDIVSPLANIKKPNNVLAPLRRNTKSLKSRPSCLRNGSSSRLKDDSYFMLDISKESHPSSIFCNSRIATEMVNGAQKDPAALETSNLSKLKGNQGNMGIHHVSLPSKNLSSRQVAEVSSVVTNKEQHVESMEGHIQLNSRKRNNVLSEDEKTDADKIKRKRMKPLMEDTHEDDNSEVMTSRSKKESRKCTKSMDCSIQLKNQNVILVENGATNSDKLKKRIEPLSGENPETYEDDDSEESEIRRPTNRRRLILNYCEDNDSGDQNLAGVEIGSAGLATQTAVVKDSSIEVSNSFLSESLKLQQYGSLPIDEPIWSGSIKIRSKRNVSVAAHLSTKCCEEVWKLAESLQSEIVVTQLSRMEAWPKSFEASRPTDNNIALYLLPCQMRQDADLDQLIKEVMENDTVLRAVIGEAEMLICPSILLPQQHQTFQGKPYLWAVFMHIKNKVATMEGKQHGKERCAEDEMGKQQASHSSVDKEGDSVALLNTDTGPEAPEEMERQGMEQEQNHSFARANTSSPATRDPTMNASTFGNHCQIQSSLAVPTGALFGFVVQRNPRIEQLIQEMQHEGAVVVAICKGR